MKTRIQKIWLASALITWLGQSAASLGDSYNFHFDEKDKRAVETEPIDERSDPAPKEDGVAPAQRKEALETKGQVPIIINNTNHNPNSNHNTITMPVAPKTTADSEVKES